MWGQRNPRKVTRPYLSEALFHIPSWDCSLASLKTASSYPILLWGWGWGRQTEGLGGGHGIQITEFTKTSRFFGHHGPNNRVDQILSSWGVLAFLQCPKGWRAVTRRFSHFSSLRPSQHFSGGHSIRPSPSGSVGGRHVFVASGRNTSGNWCFGIIRRVCEILHCALRKTLLGHWFLKSFGRTHGR